MTRGVRTDAAPAPVGAYPHARRVGDLLFLSGVGPRLPGSGDIPGNVHDAAGHLVAYDFAAQCQQVFANVRAVLEASGAAWHDLVDITVFLTDMAEFQAMNVVYAEAFGEHRPARSTVAVNGLPKDARVEIEVVAALLERHTTGAGRVVRTSLLAGVVALAYALTRLHRNPKSWRRAMAVAAAEPGQV